MATLVGGVPSCGLQNAWLSTCAAAGESVTVAFRTDASCLVRMYLLGDSSCSRTNNLTVIDG